MSDSEAADRMPDAAQPELRQTAPIRDVGNGGPERMADRTEEVTVDRHMNTGARQGGAEHAAAADAAEADAAEAGAEARETVVSVRSLTKRYGGLTAVDDITFSLDAGTITGFLGPNGAGKTTTLRLLVGLAAPTAGEALVFGRRYRELDDPIRWVGAVLESGDFHPARSGWDHLRVLALAAGIPPDRVEEVLDLVELAEAAAARPVRTYSLGMRQRLGLAGALLGSPELLILDEPANGLDPEGVAWLRAFLHRFAEQGGTVLVSSHVLAEVAQTVDQILIINRGRLVAAGRLDSLIAPGRTLEDVYLDLTAGDTAGEAA
jgi:ABC-2 type transport system ATP-binding protein